MHSVEITNFLDDKISELAKNRLPDEPRLPSGQTQYASFMMPSDEMGFNDKSPEKWASYNRTNGNWDDHKTKQDKIASSKNRFPLKGFILIV